MEGRSNRDRRAESRQATDVLDRLGGRLQYLARSIDACIGEPCHRRETSLFAKPTGECSSRHMRSIGKYVEVERKGKVFHHPVPKGAEVVTARVGSQPLDELSLTPLTLWRCDEHARPRVGSGSAEVAPDEVKAQV